MDRAGKWRDYRKIFEQVKVKSLDLKQFITKGEKVKFKETKREGR